MNGDMSEAAGGSARVTVYVRSGCHLCDAAKATLTQIGIEYEAIDITGDPELTAEYGDRVPVVMLDGKEHGYWRVEEDRLKRDLDS